MDRRLAETPPRVIEWPLRSMRRENGRVHPRIEGFISGASRALSVADTSPTTEKATIPLAVGWLGALIAPADRQCSENTRSVDAITLKRGMRGRGHARGVVNARTRCSQCPLTCWRLIRSNYRLAWMPGRCATQLTLGRR